MLSKMLVSFLLVSSTAVTRADIPVPMAPEEFIHSLDELVAVEGVTTSMDLDDGVVLAIDYNLRDVGPISIMLDADDTGSGRWLVTVRKVPVAELVMENGDIASEASDWSTLTPWEVWAVAASVMQVWSMDEDTRNATPPLAVPEPGTLGVDADLTNQKKTCKTAGYVCVAAAIFHKLIPGCLGAFAACLAAKACVADDCEGDGETTTG